VERYSDPRLAAHTQASEQLVEAEAALKAPLKVEVGRPTSAEIGELVAEGRGLPADPRLLMELTDVLDSVSDWETTARK
jgi:hypothetical protein